MATLNELLVLQGTEFDELQRLIRNYKADGSSRKTKRYNIDKLTTFPEMFKSIKAHDTKIRELNDVLPNANEPYFKEKTFEKFEDLYNSVIADLKKRLTEFEPITNADETMKTLLGGALL